MGGSDLSKAKEQLGEDYLEIVDWAFPENGLEAFKDGKLIEVQSLRKHLGEDNLKRLIKFILKYISELDIPIMRGTFIEFRNGMLNVSPIGRNCNQQERDDFEQYDAVRFVFTRRFDHVPHFCSSTCLMQRICTRQIECGSCVSLTASLAASWSVRICKCEARRLPYKLRKAEILFFAGSSPQHFAVWHPFHFAALQLLLRDVSMMCFLLFRCSLTPSVCCADILKRFLFSRSLTSFAA